MDSPANKEKKYRKKLQMSAADLRAALLSEDAEWRNKAMKLHDDGATPDGKLLLDLTMISQRLTDRAERCSLLLSWGAHFRATDRYGFSCLHYAVTANDPEWRAIAWMLMEKGLTVNGTMMCYLLKDDSLDEWLERCCCLLEWGASPNAKDPLIVSPICFALSYSEGGWEVLLAQMLRKGAKIDPTILCDIVKGSNKFENLLLTEREQRISLLLEYGIDADAGDRSGRSPLFYAITSAQPNWQRVVEQLLDCGAVATADMYTRVITDSIPISHRPSARFVPLPILTSPEERCRLLVEAGADVNAIDMYGDSPLSQAIVTETNNWKAVCSSLIRWGSLPHDHVLLSLLKAQYITEREERLRFMLSSGASPNATDSKKMTSLALAIGRSNSGSTAEMVRDLLAYGADVNTPWNNSSKLDYHIVCQLLLGSGADVSMFPMKALSLKARRLVVGDFYGYEFECDEESQPADATTERPVLC